MSELDWWVIGAYLAGMLLLAIYLGRSQQSRKDYYLGANQLPGWALATSIIATQCSTNSLLGAPAFVGFVLGGGLLWLQYELAVPLAMLALCVLFIPIRHSGVISIYAFLEQRLGVSSRLLASACFLFFRGVATGVTVYGVASVIGLVTGISYTAAVLILMGITVAYDALGGMRAVVISDVVQMLLLTAAVTFTLISLADPLAAQYEMLATRRDTLVNDWGITGSDYGFWPMLIGGFFLYVAYYGCDQSQAQRLLSAGSTQATRQILVLNGVLRFPLVLAYCMLGLGLAAYATQHADFIDALPRTAADEPNYNLVFPSFVAREFAPGLAGLAIVGLFAAAMSSIDSALNSLSASTIEDFFARFRQPSERQLFIGSKLATVFWGLFAVMFSYAVEHIAPTVLEAINKVGSMANGPLLALFVCAVFRPRVGALAINIGFCLGITTNLLAWLLLPELSWLWWNPLGFVVALGTAALAGGLLRSAIAEPQPDPDRMSLPQPAGLQLIGMAGLILVICFFMDIDAS
ncbi:MAG: sodium:solute symporter [Pseudomonadota bacterium]